MATTTTIGTARARLVTVLNTGEMDGKFHYAWPGPQIAKGAHEAAWISDIPEWTQTIPNLKAGRKQRQESYRFEVTLWVAQPDTGPDKAQVCFERTLTLLAVLENALADDVQAGTSAVQWLQLTDRVTDLIPHERGWACMVVSTVEGQARLL